MENLIKEFLKIEPLGYGDGSGYGSGSGSGDGNGSGDGSGSGSGSGNGSGDGDGYGSGDGDGYGSGNGSGYGDGYGSGDGDGYGSGYGSGYGNGYGSGDGDGSGYGNGGIKQTTLEEYKKGFLNKQIASFKTFNSKPIYYVDNIPCVFISVAGNLAKVLVIQDDFSTKKMYIAKSGNLFAHGDTKEDVFQAVQDKFFASLSFEEKKADFISKFKRDTEYANRLFFDWHHHLTGSCESGRLMFAKSHSIGLAGKMTTVEFLNLTKNEYNGDVIKEILSQIN